MPCIEILLYILLGLLAVILVPILFLTVCSLFIDPKKEYDRESRFYRGLLTHSTRIIMWLLGVRVTVRGREKLPQGENFLFICNHRSNYDPIITWAVFGEYRLSFVSKGANFKLPVYGRLIRRCCFMEIDRKNPRKAMLTVNRAAALLTETRNSVGVYPEGTRSKECVLLPFHSGMLKIAQKAEKPLVIAVIEGTETIARNIARFRRSRVVLTIAETMDAETVKSTRTTALSEYAASVMEGALGTPENSDNTTDNGEKPLIEQKENE